MNNKAILIILVLFIIGCAPKINKNKFENVNRATKSIEGAIKVGVNYQKFSELLQNMATEIAITKDQIKTEEEKGLLNNYDSILEIYQESALVWQNKIGCVAYDWIPVGQIYVEANLEPIVSKYNLTTETHTVPYIGKKFKTISGDAIQIIWEKARIQIDSVNAILNK